MILLLYAYPKNVTADPTPTQVAQLAKAVREEFGDEAENVRSTLQRVKEGGAILRRENMAARRIVVGSPEVRAIREQTSLSQSEFAQLIGVSVKTLQNWEQDRRRPTGPAVALLRIIAQQPKLAVEAIQPALSAQYNF